MAKATEEVMSQKDSYSDAISCYTDLLGSHSRCGENTLGEGGSREYKATATGSPVTIALGGTPDTVAQNAAKIRTMRNFLRIASCIFAAVVFGATAAKSAERGAIKQSSSCNWIGSGLSHELDPFDDQTVESVHFSGCSEGRVRWVYPRGAVRIVLRSDHEFRACIRVSRQPRHGASIFVQGRRGKLHPAFSPRDARPLDLVRCFASSKKQVVFYLEAEPTNHSLKKHVLEFRYAFRDSLDKDRECRPCSDGELIQAYCKSDFVLAGSMASVWHNEALQRTEITVRVNEILRQSQYPLLMTDPEGSLSQELEGDDSVGMAILHKPSRCGTKMGSGDFVFFGRWILGSPELQCAPRLAQWQKVRRMHFLKGRPMCQ